MLATRPRSALAICVAVIILAPPIAKLSLRERKLSAGDILNRSFAAQVGCGRETSDRYELVTRGTVVDTKLGVSGALTMWQRPQRLQMVVTWTNGMDYRLLVEGDTVTVDQGVVGGIRDRQTLTGTERSQHVLATTSDCDWRRTFSNVTLVGIVDFEGARAYELVLTAAPGVTRTRYISVATLLTIGEESEVRRERLEWEPPGPPHVDRIRAAYSDFRDVAGMLTPFQVRHTPTNGDFMDPMTFQIESITRNVIAD